MSDPILVHLIHPTDPGQHALYDGASPKRACDADELYTGVPAVPGDRDVTDRQLCPECQEVVDKIGRPSGQRNTVTVVLCPAVGPHGVWSEEAVAGLVGQDVKMHGGILDGRECQWISTVKAASIDDGAVKVDLAIPVNVYRFAPVDSTWWNEATTGRHCATPPE